jgi:hypothetical protein
MERDPQVRTRPGAPANFRLCAISKVLASSIIDDGFASGDGVRSGWRVSAAPSRPVPISFGTRPHLGEKSCGLPEYKKPVAKEDACFSADRRCKLEDLRTIMHGDKLEAATR